MENGTVNSKNKWSKLFKTFKIICAALCGLGTLGAIQTIKDGGVLQGINLIILIIILGYLSLRNLDNKPSQVSIGIRTARGVLWILCIAMVLTSNGFVGIDNYKAVFSS